MALREPMRVILLTPLVIGAAGCARPAVPPGPERSASPDIAALYRVDGIRDQRRLIDGQPG